MVFIVMEIQSNNETAGTLITTYTDRLEAESVYHLTLGAAAISKVPTHSVTLLSDTGKSLKSESYTHKVEVTENE